LVAELSILHGSEETVNDESQLRQGEGRGTNRVLCGEEEGEAPPLSPPFVFLLLVVKAKFRATAEVTDAL
jgi:hypothetical protein